MGMMLADRVLETTTTTGTSTITLGGAVLGYQAFSSVITTDGDKFTYVISGGSEWECGIGTRLSSTTFERSYITASSNSGAAVNFSVVNKEVWIDWTYDLINNMRFENFIINGGCEISQENASTATASNGGHVCDMFKYRRGGAALSVNTERIQDAPSVSNQGGFGLRYSAKISVTTGIASPAATDHASIQTYIDMYSMDRSRIGTSNAHPISVGFWVKASRTGQYTFFCHNFARDRCYVASFNVNTANTFEYKSITIAPDTAGGGSGWTVGSSSVMFLGWTMMAGSNLLGTANTWVSATNIIGISGQVAGAQTGDTFQITGVTCVLGPVPVPQNMVSMFIRPFDIEFDLCKKYYEKSYEYNSLPGAVTSPGQMRVFQDGLTSAAHVMNNAVRCSVDKISNAPTILMYSPTTGTVAKARDVTNAADVNGTSSNPGAKGFEASATQSASATSMDMLFHWVVDGRF